jgi:hypothetical protein
VDTDYLDRHYEAINEEYLALRGNPEFQWSVSHGTYMRALTNPSTQSLMGELNETNIATLENYAYQMLDHWLGWLDNATPVPESERAALRDYDFKVRELGYARDPMNKLAEQVFGADQVDNMLNIRMGREQMRRRLDSDPA